LIAKTTAEIIDSARQAWPDAVRGTLGPMASMETLQINPVKGKDVLTKPNFNTADLRPGSTNNE
jgi:uncharacterized protein (DUF362 family)